MCVVNIRDPSGSATSEYKPFVSWNPDITVGEIEAFLAFWSGSRNSGPRRNETGRSFHADCYSQSAENGQLRRLAARSGREHEVEDFIGSEQWVDLLQLVKDQLVTGLPSNGLKTSPPWRVSPGVAMT